MTAHDAIYYYLTEDGEWYKTVGLDVWRSATAVRTLREEGNDILQLADNYNRRQILPADEAAEIKLRANLVETQIDMSDLDRDDYF